VRWPARTDDIGRPAAWPEIAPGQELHLVEVAGFAPSPFEAEFGRHIAVAVPLADFDGLKHRLRAHGATLIDPQRPSLPDGKEGCRCAARLERFSCITAGR
jgi:hypothetical protein